VRPIVSINTSAFGLNIAITSTDSRSAYGSPAFADESRWRADAQAAVVRSFRPDGPARQLVAAMRSPSRVDQLRLLDVPTLVVHGTHDTLIDPIGGRRTAELIPHGRFEIIEGMGHDYPPQLSEVWTRTVVSHITTASGSTSFL
jgi:pimeloyl-ACP methyl ester carboxylesterase